MRSSRVATTAGAALLSLATLTASVLGLGSAQAATPSAGHPLSTGQSQAHRPAPVWPAAHTKGPAIPRIAWHRCPEASQQRLALQCATAAVPLDYANPNGPKILLDLARHRATGKKIGSLFVNPGGPGGSAVDHAEEFLSVLGKPVTSRFDIVAMDPRGIGVHSQAGCWSVKPEPARNVAFPNTAAKVKTNISHGSYERAACANSGRPIIDHMSTGNVARDLDVMRQAVGDKQLNYYGVSYGTFLASTYAAMFPSKVRSVIEDGVVDPINWTTGRGNQGSTVPVSARNGSGPGADETLRAVFQQCRAAGPKRCPHGADIAKEWDALISRLRQVTVKTPNETLELGDLLSSALTSLYDPSTIPSMIDWIHQDYLAAIKKSAPAAKKPQAVGPPTLGARGDVITPTKEQPDNSTFFDTFKMAGVMCSDAVNPSNEQTWASYANASSASSWFTPIWTWNSSLCAGWPGHDTGAYRGPFNVKTAHPLLIVGNTHDPATPLSAAQSTNKLIPGSRLIVVDAFGHTAANKSSAALKAMQQYLIGGKLPANNAHCKADKSLF